MVIANWRNGTSVQDRGRPEPGGHPIDIRVLGPFAVTARGRAMPLGGPRASRLLALLAMNGNQAVAFDRIVDALWTDPPASARQQVHNLVSGLRSRLDHDGLAVVRCGDSYRLELPGLAVDGLRFRSAVRQARDAEAAGDLAEAIRQRQAALEQWRGPALSGLPGAGFAAVAASLNDERATVLEQVAELQLRWGDASASLGDLHSLVAENPFRESLRAVLMKVLNRAGRQADALEIYQQGRQLLTEELGLDPSPVLQAAHQEVLAGGPQPGPARHGEPARALDGPVQAPSGRNVLPRDIPEFTGRSNEIRQLKCEAQRAGAGAPAILVISGMAGAGKSALAVHVAHGLAQHYPDGQYFVDLQGFGASGDPVSPLHGLSLLLRDSGVPPELIPADLEGRSALWRSQLAGKRALLLLDNAMDAAAVRPLLPGVPGSLVLVTSRTRMAALEGTVPLWLDVMSRSEGAMLFSQICGSRRAEAEPAAVQDVVRYCGQLPLAIQIAAARLRERPHWTVTQLASQLRAPSTRSRVLSRGDRSVTILLREWCRQLTENQRRVFGYLSLHPGDDFDHGETAALCGLSEEETADCLERMFEVNLLQLNDRDRYQLHDLVRDCAAEVLAEESTRPTCSLSHSA